MGRRGAGKVRGLAAVSSHQADRASMALSLASRSKRVIAVGSQIRAFVSDRGRAMVVTTKMFGMMRRIAQERDGVTTGGRDLLAEACADMRSSNG